VADEDGRGHRLDHLGREVIEPDSLFRHTITLRTGGERHPVVVRGLVEER
jgi:hypothetical protein